MAWTYSGDPSTSLRDQVRFLVGDTRGQQEVSLQDAEIDWLLTQTANDTYMAGSMAAQEMAGGYAMLTTKARTIGDLTVVHDYVSAEKRMLLLAERLRLGRRAGQIGSPIMESTSVSQFTLGMLDDGGSTTQDADDQQVGF